MSRMCGARSNSPSPLLVRRVTLTSGEVKYASSAGKSAEASRSSYSNSQRTRSHFICAALRSGSQAARKRTPSGDTALSVSGRAARSTSRVTRKSISSHSLAMPTDSGRQMEMSAWGLKPSLYFIGVPARRKMRCTTRMRSRWDM